MKYLIAVLLMCSFTSAQTEMNVIAKRAVTKPVNTGWTNCHSAGGEQPSSVLSCDPLMEDRPTCEDKGAIMLRAEDGTVWCLVPVPENRVWLDSAPQ